MNLRRIKRFGVMQTAKIVAVMYFLLTAMIFFPFGGLMMLIGTDAFDKVPFGGTRFLLLAPFFYAVVGFIFTAIGCAFYNLIARYTGGIEVEVE